MEMNISSESIGIPSRIAIFILLTFNSLIFWFLFGVGIDYYQDNWLEGGIILTLYLYWIPVLLLILILISNGRIKTTNQSRQFGMQTTVSISIMILSKLLIISLQIPDTPVKVQTWKTLHLFPAVLGVLVHVTYPIAQSALNRYSARRKNNPTER